MLSRLVLTTAATFALVLARLAGFVVSSPFPGAHVGRTQRAGLVGALAWVATMFAPAASAPTELGYALIGAVMVEVACGLLMGIAFRLVFMAAEVTGQMLSQAVGLSTASILNPTVEAQDVILARVVTLLAMLLALSAGVQRVALGYLLGSFRVLPVGSAMSFAPTATVFIALTIQSFTVGVQLAMPVIAVALIVQLALAMIARAAPALQIFSVGFSVLLTTGFLVLIVSVRDISGGLLVHFGSLARWLDAALAALIPEAAR